MNTLKHSKLIKDISNRQGTSSFFFSDISNCVIPGMPRVFKVSLIKSYCVE